MLLKVKNVVVLVTPQTILLMGNQIKFSIRDKLMELIKHLLTILLFVPKYKKSGSMSKGDGKSSLIYVFL